jgi:beta-mannosidase
MTGIDLNGQWRLTMRESVASARAHWNAQIPGDVTTALVDAGVLPDPQRGIGALSAAWVAQTGWRMSREFDVPRDIAGARAWLVFEQLSPATIELNGDVIGADADDCRVNITRRLKPGRNTIALSFLVDASQAKSSRWEPVGFVGSARLEYTHERVRLDTTCPG